METADILTLPVPQTASLLLHNECDTCNVFIYSLLLITSWSPNNHIWESQSHFLQKTQGLVPFQFILLTEPHSIAEGISALWEKG